MTELKVGIRDLKTNLSAYLRKVRAGHAITITDHGREIGRILPIAEDLDGQIEHLRKAGLINWDGKKLGPSSSPLINTTDRLASDLLLEMRE